MHSRQKLFNTSPEVVEQYTKKWEQIELEDRGSAVRMKTGCLDELSKHLELH